VKTYIGDSVYAEIKDGFLILTTENGYPDDPRNKIFLEPQVWGDLKMWADAMLEKMAAAKP
jgi:hypothetical protein